MTLLCPAFLPFRNCSFSTPQDSEGLHPDSGVGVTRHLTELQDGSGAQARTVLPLFRMGPGGLPTIQTARPGNVGDTVASMSLESR